MGGSDEKVEGRTVHKSEGSSVSGVRSGGCGSGGQSVTHTKIRVGGGVFPETTDHVTIALPFFCFLLYRYTTEESLKVAAQHQRQRNKKNKTKIRRKQTIEQLRVNRVAL